MFSTNPLKSLPRNNEIKTLIKLNEPIELFPNLIINVNSGKKVSQQLHYIINRNKHGTYHLGSTDLVCHDDFIKELVNKLGDNKSRYKLVYTTNESRYLAVLPKYNKLPKHLQLNSDHVLNNSI